MRKRFVSLRSAFKASFYKKRHSHPFPFCYFSIPETRLTHLWVLLTFPFSLIFVNVAAQTISLLLVRLQPAFLVMRLNALLKLFLRF